MTNSGAARLAGLFDRPIFIISSPRSGSTLLFETMEKAPGLFTTGQESHGRIERIPPLWPGNRDWSSNRLEAADATSDVVQRLSAAFLADLKDRDGRRPQAPFRMLEKTPKNALRIPFFNAAWPDALFVYLYRDPRETLASMMEAWRSGRFRTYPRLPEWRGQAWSMLLVPGWRELNELPLAQIVAHQWAITTKQILADLEALPVQRVTAVSYNDFLTAPQAVLERLTARLDLKWDRTLGEGLPFSKTTVSAPGVDKWRRVAADIEAVWSIVEEPDARARAFIEAAGVS